MHLAGVLFEKAAGVEMLHVPYKGGAPASMDLLGGNVAMMFDTVSVALPNVGAGKLRALAVAAPERHFALPDVPTFAELGFKGVEAATWAGVFAPKGTPPRFLRSCAPRMRRCSPTSRSRTRCAGTACSWRPGRATWSAASSSPR